MANTTDKSILTAAGKALLAQLNAEEKPLIIDKMIFANVPNRPEFPQPDDVVPTDHVVHQEGVEQRGRLSADSVIYSTTLTSDVGPFEFNWTGAYCSEYGVLVTIDHHALTPKSADEPGVAGNTLVRSVVLEYKDIAEITNITVDASSWQYNATPRMKKMDDDVAQAIIDQNGKDWFIEDGFLVTPQASAFNIKAGAGYVSGNRVMLEFDRNVQVPNKPSFIYVDAHREGTPTGEQVTLFDFVVTAEEKDDYTDANGMKHFVCKIAQVMADGSVSDLRPEGDSASRVYVLDQTRERQNASSGGSGQMDIYEGAQDTPLKVGADRFYSLTSKKEWYAWDLPEGSKILNFVDNNDYGTALLTTDVGSYILLTKNVLNNRGFMSPVMQTYVSPFGWGLNHISKNNADAIQECLEYCKLNGVSMLGSPVDVVIDKTIYMPNFPDQEVITDIDFGGMRLKPTDAVFKPMESGKKVDGKWVSSMMDPLQHNMSFNTTIKNLSFFRDDVMTKGGRIALSLKDFHQGCRLDGIIARNFQTILDSYNNFYLKYGTLKLFNQEHTPRTGYGFIFRTAINLNDIEQLVSANVHTGYLFEGGVTALNIANLSFEGQTVGAEFTGEIYSMSVTGSYGEDSATCDVYFNFTSWVHNAKFSNMYINSRNPDVWIIDTLSNNKSGIFWDETNHLEGTANKARLFKNKSYGMRKAAFASKPPGPELENILLNESDMGIGTVIEQYAPNYHSGQKTFNIAKVNAGIIPSNQSGRMTVGFNGTVLHGLYDPVESDGQVEFKSKILYSDTQELVLAFKIADVMNTKTIRGRMVANQFYEYTPNGLEPSTKVTMDDSSGHVYFTVTGLSGSAFNIVGAEARVI